MLGGWPQMANPLNRLQKAVKSGTGLFGTSEEEMSSLAQSAGRSQQPGSPLEGSVLGGTPDQAKMMGTPASKIGAIRQQIRSEFDLNSQQRQAQARKAATAEEQAQEAKQQSLIGLGDMQSRVQQIADKMLTAEGKTQVEQALKVNDAAVSKVVTDPTAQATLKQLLEKVGNNTATNQDILAAANLLGFTQVTDVPAMKDQLKASFLTAAETAGAYAAGAVADNILVSQLSPEQVQSLGFTDVNQLATQLGVDPAQIGTMTVQQVQETVSNLQQAEYARVERLKETMASPAASQAERIAAVRELRNLGGAGVRTTEADFAKLNEQVQRGDEITFNGEVRPLAELLSDDYIAGVVKNYFDDPASAAKLMEQEPEFAKWIEANKGVLEQAAKDVDQDIADFSKIQEDNADLRNTPGGSLSDEAADAIFGDTIKTLQADRLEAPPIIKAMKSNQISQGAQQALISGFNQIANLGYTDITKDMAAQSPQQLAQKGLLDSGGIARFTTYLGKTKAIQDSVVPEDIIATAMPNMRMDDVNRIVEESAAARTFFGDNITSDELRWVDSDGDGKADAPAKLASTMKQVFQPLTVSQIGNVGQLPDMNAGINSVASRLQGLDPVKRELLPAIRDGVFDSNDAANYMSRHGNLGELEKVSSTLANAGGAAPGLGAINAKINETADKLLNQGKKDVALFQGETLPNLNNKVNRDPIEPINKGRGIMTTLMTQGGTPDTLWHYFNDVWGQQQDYSTDEWNKINEGKSRLEQLKSSPEAQESPTYRRKIDEQLSQINGMIEKRNANFNRAKAEFDAQARKALEGLQARMNDKEWKKGYSQALAAKNRGDKGSANAVSAYEATKRYARLVQAWLDNGWSPGQPGQGYRNSKYYG
jgi:hypothetical protein